MKKISEHQNTAPVESATAKIESTQLVDGAGTLRMGLIGAGLSKSRMPRLQEYFGAIADIPVRYELFDSQSIVGFDAIQQILHCRDQGYVGVNVTHPYKQVAWNMLTGLSGDVLPFGAINTIRFSGSELLGANTDYTGFLQGYRAKWNNVRPGRVLLAGAGGVGHATAFGLIELQAEEILIFDNNLSQATELQKLLQQKGAQTSIVTQPELLAAMEQVDGLVNCTTLGMFGYPGSVFPAAAIGGQRWAFDAVYTPLETEFLKDCARCGIELLSGFDLWFYQGLEAFNIFTGSKLTPEPEMLAETLTWMN